MTHRDELLALKARVEAQERDLGEARSENDLLRAAHARKTQELESLRRRLDALEGAGGGAPPSGAGGDAAAPTPAEPPAAEAFGRAVRFSAIALGLTMLGTLMLSHAMAARARHRPHPIHAAHAVSEVTPLVRTGTVVEASGPAVVAVGERCTVERIPVAATPFDCRVEVRCGEQTLYGADPRTGYVRCAGREVVNDPNTTAFDGDPAMNLDLARDTVTVEERVGMATQRVRIRL